jgi:hypothetical protein
VLEKIRLPFAAAHYKRQTWPELNFVARVVPDGDILPVRTVYDGVTQNIGNNYLHPNPVHPEPVYMAGPDPCSGSDSATRQDS